MQALRRVNPLIALIGVIVAIAACGVAIGAWLFPVASQTSALPRSRPPGEDIRAAIGPTATPDCASQVELGPWTHLGNVLIDASDSWVQADFWSPGRTMKQGYDEVSTIFEPDLKVDVVGVQGNGWEYPRNWPREYVEHCMNKHISDSWNIRHKRLIFIDLTELCALATCN